MNNVRTTNAAYAALLSAVFGILASGPATAIMGGETIMSRVDADHDKSLSLDEVRVAAGKRYDLIQSKNGKVTLLQLAGRVKAEDLKGSTNEPLGLETLVSKSDYLQLASKFFAAANTKRKEGVAAEAGTLSLDELGTEAGKKLVGLLQ